MPPGDLPCQGVHVPYWSKKCLSIECVTAIPLHEWSKNALTNYEILNTELTNELTEMQRLHQPHGFHITTLGVAIAPARHFGHCNIGRRQCIQPAEIVMSNFCGCHYICGACLCSDN